MNNFERLLEKMKRPASLKFKKDPSRDDGSSRVYYIGHINGKDVVYEANQDVPGRWKGKVTIDHQGIQGVFKYFTSANKRELSRMMLIFINQNYYDALDAIQK